MIEGYGRACSVPSDINEHVPTLCRYALQSESVLECGVRTAVSTWGLALGLHLNGKETKRLVSVDLKRDQAIGVVESAVTGMVDYSFWEGNDMDYPVDDFDIIFIDTWHVYGWLKREL